VAQAALRSQPDPSGESPDAPAAVLWLALLATRDESDHDEARRWLASAGFALVTVGDAAEAVVAFEARCPAVVLADMALHDEGGRTLCEALAAHKEGRTAPILALCSTRRQAEAALSCGASDVLERPFNWHVASLRAERLARSRAAELELGRAREELLSARTALEEERRQRRRTDHFDALTGLPDGERLERAMESALVAASPTSQVAVALFEVEHLAVVNGRLGRARANLVLQQVAQRLTVALRSEDVLRSTGRPSMSMAARMGGGLFAAMLTGLPGGNEARAVVRTLLDRLSGRYVAGLEEIVLSTSVGVALAPGDGRSAEAMLQRAELAVSEAVESGGAIRFYGQSTPRVTERSRAIGRLLPNALARGELAIHYQPLIEGASRKITAAEALLRWNSPELGAVPPGEFVPLAEESGLMVPIGGWVLRTVCAQVRAWIDEGLAPVRVAVNVSLCQLVRDDLAEVVREALAANGVDAALLEVELSERGVLRSDPEILRQLHRVRDLGLRVAIDDFGTGNSAVAYLKQFPIDVLKIDQSFIRGVASSSEDAAITSATIAMARQLGLRIVAEGVESPEQLAFLQLHGCREYQGFLFSPAVPPAAFGELLRGDLGPAPAGEAS
jgi:diguanylate cyclase (GGDEF)-like protein